jgi:transcription elongation GreA/GreB family factor
MPEATMPTPGAAERVEMTRARYEELEAALTALETKARPELERQLQRAALFLAPEVASDAIQQAKAELAQVDDQIGQLQALLKRAQVVDPPVDPTDVELGTAVTVRYEDDREETLTVVGPTEGGARLDTVVSTSALGTAVTVRYEDDREETLTVVGPTEGGARLDTVVSTSALGKALLKKRPGQKVTADGADGQSVTVEIVSVKAAKGDPASAVGSER